MVESKHICLLLLELKQRCFHMTIWWNFTRCSMCRLMKSYLFMANKSLGPGLQALQPIASESIQWHSSSGVMLFFRLTFYVIRGPGLYKHTYFIDIQKPPEQTTFWFNGLILSTMYMQTGLNQFVQAGLIPVFDVTTYQIALPHFNQSPESIVGWPPIFALGWMSNNAPQRQNGAPLCSRVLRLWLSLGIRLVVLTDR